MCWGGMETTSETTSKTTLPKYIRKAGEKAVGAANDYLDRGFTPYDGQRVADFTTDQTDAFGLIRTLATTPNPYLQDIESLFKSYANTPATSISTPSILGGDTDVRTSGIQDYMNPYLRQVLDPQLREIERQGKLRRNQNASAATMEGAFGDFRHGVMDASQVRDENQLLTDTTGRAHHAAFDAAGNLRSRDVDNLMRTDQTNAMLLEEALKRMVTGGAQLRDLDKYSMGRDLDLAKSLGVVGEMQQKHDQSKLNTDFEEFLRKVSFEPDAIKLLAGIAAGVPYEKTQTLTTMAPDNSGWQMLGSLGGTALKAAMAPMTGGMSMMLPMGTGGTGATHTPWSYSSAFPMPL